MSAIATQSAPARDARADRTLDALRRAGNPFRNYFARNPDDDVCARYHVPELFAAERDVLLGVVDLYRYDPMTHSEVVPVLGNKGAGKTHLLHSIKHGRDGAWQLLVTPGTYQKDSEFPEYLLFQIIDTLLGGGVQKGVRPLDFVGDAVVRGLLASALASLPAEQRLDLFPPPGLGRWAKKLGLGSSQAGERCEWLSQQLTGHAQFGRQPVPISQALAEAGIAPESAAALIARHVEATEAHNAAGLMRRAVFNGFARAVLLRDEAELASFLTFGFAELDFKVRPSRQDLVLNLFRTLMEVFRGLKTPVVVAFDQLEDLLLARRSDDAHQIAEAFFAGIVQVMHQIDGLCFLVFAERGLWNRFVPSLDGYIQDRLNNPVHVPRHGTVKALRLEAPPAELVRRVVEARMRPALDEAGVGGTVSDIHPFDDAAIARIARTEPTLRDMLQQFRHLFDHVVYGAEEARPTPQVTQAQAQPAAAETHSIVGSSDSAPPSPPAAMAEVLTNRVSAFVEPEVPAVASVTVIQAEPEAPPVPPVQTVAVSAESLLEMWGAEQRTAYRKLEPEGALPGATRELQAGLGAFLQLCHEHGVKVGPWRLQHVVTEYSFGDHPTYGSITIAHWASKDGTPWRVGVGLFLAKGAGKPKELEVKLGVMSASPAVVDHLILLRPEEDLSLTGKSKTLWADAEKRGHHARLEPVDLGGFALLYSFPRWLAAVAESLPAGQPMPNLGDLVQEHCEKMLEQVCMPIQ